MSSKFLVAIAVLLLIGAGLSAYWGVTQVPSESAVSEPALPLNENASQQALDVSISQDNSALVNVVTLARDVKVGAPLVRQDILMQAMQIPPPESISTLDEVLGRTVWHDMSAGAILSEASFGVGGPLPRMIAANERALAIPVNEIISGGGHLRPGDYVDVLLYLEQGAMNIDFTTQVVMPALRVLSVGDELGRTLDGSSLTPTAEEAENSTQRRGIARSVVLAIPDALVTRFTLASHVGVLDLAVRSIDDVMARNYYANGTGQIESLNKQLYQFQELALRNSSNADSNRSLPDEEVPIDVFRGTAVSRDIP